MSDFPSTRHSIIERMRNPDEGVRRHAFGDLVEGYWKALQRYVGIQWRLSHDEAQDVTQGFLTEALQKEWLARYDPDKARFRTFIRVCIDRFVLNRQQAASRLKRGGGVDVVSLDEPDADEEMRIASQPDADDVFRREFVRALFERTVEEVRGEYEAAGKAMHFAIFERYDIDPPDEVSYAIVAREFNLTSSQVTNTLAQVRRRFRERALEILRTLSGSEAEFRREAREIFGMAIE
jgi:DNA-directed RNA polymerase specialized sigma24 family protein